MTDDLMSKARENGEPTMPSQAANSLGALPICGAESTTSQAKSLETSPSSQFVLKKNKQTKSKTTEH